jgi:conjugative transposon TraN protein
MKRQSVIGVVLMIISFLPALGFGQSVYIDPTRIAISDHKTTNLIFPYPIKSVDRGSRDVLVQKAEGVENVLQVKAASGGFAETNLTIMTADGKFYSYLVVYTSRPSELNLKIEGSAESLVVFDAEGTTEKIHQAASLVLNKKRIIHNSKVRSYQVELSVKGVYVQDDQLYFQVGLKNDSWIDYPIRQLKFFIRDTKKGKRTTVQEIELEPVFKLGDTKVIHNRSQQTVVFTVPSFTIPKSKKLLLQMQEANGGRHLQLKISNKQLIRAWRVF